MPPFDIAPLMQIGAMGVVLAWFMLRLEGIMRDVQRSNDRMSRAVLLLLVESPGVSPGARGQVQSTLEEMESEAKARAERR